MNDANSAAAAKCNCLCMGENYFEEAEKRVQQTLLN